MTWDVAAYGTYSGSSIEGYDAIGADFVNIVTKNDSPSGRSGFYAGIVELSPRSPEYFPGMTFKVEFSHPTSTYDQSFAAMMHGDSWWTTPGPDSLYFGWDGAAWTIKIFGVDSTVTPVFEDDTVSPVTNPYWKIVRNATSIDWRYSTTGTTWTTLYTSTDINMTDRPATVTFYGFSDNDTDETVISVTEIDPWPGDTEQMFMRRDEPPIMPASADIVDTFADGIDLDDWVLDSKDPPIEEGGRVIIPEGSALTSDDLYDLKNSYVYTHYLATEGDQQGLTILSKWRNLPGSDQFSMAAIVASSSTLTIFYQDRDNPEGNLVELPYSRTNHQWLRIEANSTWTLTFKTSMNGTNWTPIHTSTFPVMLDACVIALGDPSHVLGG